MIQSPFGPLFLSLWVLHVEFVTFSLLDGNQVTASRTYTHSRLIETHRDSSVVLERLAPSIWSLSVCLCLCLCLCLFLCLCLCLFLFLCLCWCARACACACECAGTCACACWRACRAHGHHFPGPLWPRTRRRSEGCIFGTENKARPKPVPRFVWRRGQSDPFNASQFPSRQR